MSEKVYLIVLVLALAVMVRARHMHPQSIGALDYEESNFENFDNDEEHAAEIDGMPIDVIRNLKPQRFVPINKEFFFKRFSDCANGFKRDILGVCREVW